jgi:hypothetical protein
MKITLEGSVVLKEVLPEEKKKQVRKKKVNV